MADIILPPTSDVPSPSALRIASTELDRVLRVVPELTGPLAEALDLLGDDDPETALRALRRARPAAFATIMLVVTGGYYSTAHVRLAIGYAGQEALRVDVHELPEYLEDGSLERVLERGPLYRDVTEQGE